MILHPFLLICCFKGILHIPRQQVNFVTSNGIMTFFYNTLNCYLSLLISLIFLIKPYAKSIEMLILMSLDLYKISICNNNFSSSHPNRKWSDHREYCLTYIQFLHQILIIYVVCVACFSVHVRGSEYIPLLGSNDPSSFLAVVPDIEIWGISLFSVWFCFRTLTISSF